MAAKQRTHNEWFRAVSLGGRKSCPHCRAKLGQGESVWSWGEYHNAKWRTVRHFCRECWNDIASRLNAHTGDCGCSVNLVVRSSVCPNWLTLEECIDNELERSEKKD